MIQKIIIGLLISSNILFANTFDNIIYDIKTRNYMLVFTQFGGGDFLIDFLKNHKSEDTGKVDIVENTQIYSIELYIELIKDEKLPFALKLGYGRIEYLEKASFHDYSEDAIGTNIEYSFDYTSIGLSLLDMSVDVTAELNVDLMVPLSEAEGSITTKKGYSHYSSSSKSCFVSYSEFNKEIDPFIALAFNIHKKIGFFTFGTGIHYTYKKAMRKQWITLQGGVRF